ncbi:MAG TPA: Ig-like domain-containing protein, partial [Verrucomicrobiae bacterium]|nr:Ig-like domain-containing protein [Verrucomicrobiae bacterium]
MILNRPAFRRLTLLFLALGLAGRAAAVQISLTSDTNFLTDFGVSPTLQSDHVSVSVTNTDGITYSNLWVTLGSFTNTSLQLGGGDPGQYPVGRLANSQAGAAFFYVQATNDPGNKTYNDQFTVRVYNGLPATGTLLASSNFPVVVQTTISAMANKINSVTFTPTNNPVVGGIVKISVFGDTGGVGSGNTLDFTGASWTNWNAGAFQLVACSITVTNGSNPAFNQFLTNTLTAAANSHFTGNGNLYEADYWFRAIATTGTNATPVSAITYIQSGGQIKHTSLSAGQLPPVLPATNLTTLTSLPNFTQLYTNQTVTFSLAVSNLGTAFGVTLDRFVDTLPTGFVYVPNSSTFGGARILEPANAGGVLTWSQANTYTVPAGASSNFVFQAVVPGASSPTYFTNSCVAYVQNFQIGATLTNNAPATETVRALIAPIAGSVTNTNAFENQVLTVPAPGVLANTVEPNGFTPSVISNSPPANGSATVNANGSYTYTPAAFFWGWDSFTFTLTNGNSRVSTGTNYVYVNWVNQPPYFTAGPGQTNNENSGPVSVSNWATGISPGTNDPSQVLAFHVSNDNSGLFSVQPGVSTNGTLAYTPAPFAWGDATVSVYLTDDAGGISSTQTFHIHLN